MPAVRPPSPTPQGSFDRAVALADVVDRLGEWSPHSDVPTMDALGVFDGFAMYRTEIDAHGASVLEIGEVRDRVIALLDGSPVGVLARDHHDTRLTLPADARGTLDLLVEDQGRVNYGSRIGEPKGLIGEVLLDGEPLRRWEVLPLALGDLSPIAAEWDAAPSRRGRLAGPVFARGEFTLDRVADLFLETSAWGKGVAWINGFNLGRYWSRGPQRTLYVPAPILQEGRNEVVDPRAARRVGFDQLRAARRPRPHRPLTPRAVPRRVQASRPSGFGGLSPRWPGARPTGRRRRR